MAVLHFSVERRHKTTPLCVSETHCPLFSFLFLLSALAANLKVHLKLELAHKCCHFRHTAVTLSLHTRHASEDMCKH